MKNLNLNVVLQISKKKKKSKHKGVKKKEKILHSPAGNRTRVFRVTGGDTYHYTTEDQLVNVNSLTCIYLHSTANASTATRLAL